MTSSEEEKPNGAGILYCATLDPIYVAEAFLSALSAKEQLPNVTIAIATDLPDNPLIAEGPFDIVIPLDRGEEFGSDWVTGKYQRLLALTLSPFEQTLHIDCDTRVLSPKIASVFDKLAEKTEFLAAECLSETSYCRRVYGERMFNGGVLAFRKTDKTRKLLQLWYRLTGFQHRCLMTGRVPSYLSHIGSDRQRKKLLRMDQISLAQIVSPIKNRLDVDLEVLPRKWNDRLTKRSELAEKDVLISHLPIYHETVLPDVLALAHKKLKCGQVKLATLLYDAVRTIVIENGQINLATETGSDGRSVVWQWEVLAREHGCSNSRMLEYAILHNFFGQWPAAVEYGAIIGEVFNKAPAGTLKVNFVRPGNPIMY